MTEIGDNLRTGALISLGQRASRKLHPALAVLLALPALVWAWGFTVDDALITARVAAHIQNGLGYRFNPAGSIVDAVTPLGLPFLLAPFASGGTLAAFGAAKWLGALAWLAAAALLSGAIGRTEGRGRRWLPFALLAVSLPCAAWAASGMETGLVALLAAFAVCGERDRPLVAGACAALRPELLPWALTLGALGGLVPAPASDSSRRKVVASVLGALGPFVLVALARQRLFGHPLPLAFYAKPSDLEHGLRYALGGAVFTGLPVLLVAPLTLARLSARGRVRFAACVAHLFALTLAGGDWMSLYRLWVPVVPTLALVASEIAEHAAPLASALRGALALLASLVLAIGLGPRARRVGAERAQLIGEGRSALGFAKRIATEDAGWVGALGEAEVVDLAGVTEPTVAFFPGGHTSKRIPAAWLRARDPDAVVLLLAQRAPLVEPYWESAYARAVEQSVARTLAERYRVRALLPFGEQRYVVLERAPGD